jgi:hypothetical protein
MNKVSVQSQGRSGAVFVASSLLAIAVAATAVHHLSAQAARTNLDGVYVLRKGLVASEEAARKKAIGAATSTLDATVRGQWRAVLEISSVPEQRLRIASTSTEIAVAKGDSAALATPLSGATRQLSEDRTVKQQMDGRSLVQTMSSSALSGLSLSTTLEQVSRYRLGADGRTLEMETTIRGGALNTSIVFRTTYERL